MPFRRPITAPVIRGNDAADVVELSPSEQRAAAFARVWPLLPTSVPTRELVDRYLDDVVQLWDA